MTNLLQQTSVVDRIGRISSMVSSFKKPVAVAILATAGSALFNSALAADGTIKAFLVQGNVKIVDNESGRSTPLKRGQTFGDGFTVITESDSSALLLFSNGSAVNVTPDSSLELKEFTQDSANTNISLQPETSASKTDLKLDYGGIIGEVKKLNPSSSYTVSTPAGSAGIRGTTYEVYYSEATGETTIRTIEGTVVASFEGNVLNVPAGENVQVNESGLGQLAANNPQQTLATQRIMAASLAAGRAGEQAENAAGAAGVLEADARDFGDSAATAAFAQATRDTANLTTLDAITAAANTAEANTVAAFQSIVNNAVGDQPQSDVSRIIKTAGRIAARDVVNGENVQDLNIPNIVSQAERIDNTINTIDTERGAGFENLPIEGIPQSGN
ncbi:FecR family protein [Rubellicoccus peritrichatus]|uniref:FecR family protein n=1 Tax=Rubellicoccus peritrichatus TaxID=3080537 RepID=A0AAQ3QW13_9BACT|nr:FecR family protein [Puniceicoccus sp. CR14]WOO41417.1 FecR family protein [Puniceicoccus sp. CR14]